MIVERYRENNKEINHVNSEFERIVSEATAFGKTAIAVAYSKFENYSAPGKMLQLFSKFRTFDELKVFIPEVNSLH